MTVEGLVQAYTGFRSARSKGIRAGRGSARLPRTQRIPKVPVHAARKGDRRALCGAAVVQVSEREWPIWMGACRACLKISRSGEA